MHVGKLRGFKAFGFMPFANGTFFSGEVSGGFLCFKLRCVGRSGGFDAGLTGCGMFGLRAGFFFAVLLVVFFLRSVLFARCVFCTAECRACSEAFAAGVRERVVNSKAQSVIEILFIRATGQSPGKCRLSIIPAYDLQNPSILIYIKPRS
jgi:Tetrahydromethanopterin S-methyltransferase, F subunit (MtrF).